VSFFELQVRILQIRRLDLLKNYLLSLRFWEPISMHKSCYLVNDDGEGIMIKVLVLLSPAAGPLSCLSAVQRWRYRPQICATTTTFGRVRNEPKGISQQTAAAVSLAMYKKGGEQDQ
jgi:hypothetical protein